MKIFDLIVDGVRFAVVAAFSDLTSTNMRIHLPSMLEQIVLPSRLCISVSLSSDLIVLCHLSMVGFHTSFSFQDMHAVILCIILMQHEATSTSR